ncbi:unnamed protein product [Lampetra fluviatilis]
MSWYSRRENPLETTSDEVEETPLQQATGAGDPVNNPTGEEEAATLTVQLVTTVARGEAAESAVEVPTVEAAQSIDTILWGDQMATELTTAPAAWEKAPDRPRRMTPVKEFVALEGDWGAFTRRFEAEYLAIEFTVEEVLNVLYTNLDDDALAVFQAVPEERRATLQKAYGEMVIVFNTPSNTRGKFLQSKLVEAKTPLAYRRALMELDQVAYPRLNEVAQDSLVMEKMLGFPQEMGVILLIVEKEVQTSSWFFR